LAHGAAGTALVHIERALTGHAPWKHAHRWIVRAASGEISASDTTGLYLGAPAVAFTLNAAARVWPPRSAAALQTIDQHAAPLPASGLHGMPLLCRPWTRMSPPWPTAAWRRLQPAYTGANCPGSASTTCSTD